MNQDDSDNKKRFVKKTSDIIERDIIERATKSLWGSIDDYDDYDSNIDEDGTEDEEDEQLSFEGLASSIKKDDTDILDSNKYSVPLPKKFKYQIPKSQHYNIPPTKLFWDKYDDDATKGVLPGGGNMADKSAKDTDGKEKPKWPKGYTQAIHDVLKADHDKLNPKPKEPTVDELPKQFTAEQWHYAGTGYGTPSPTGTEADKCLHDWKLYQGFHFSDIYCTKCGQTRPLDPSK